MKVIPYQVRKADNWMYLVIDDKTKEAAVVDPWDHEQMTQRVKEEGLKVAEEDSNLDIADEL
jgi:hydroxyacylglutathione hydrolase